MKKILCLGDSLTKGRVGYSYTEYLNNKEIINKGHDGDTTYHTYQRLKKYLKKDKYNNIDTIIISIGINDILIPFLAKLTPIWYLIMKPREYLLKCLKSDKEFETAYENYFDILKEKNIILVGLPKIQVKGFPQELIVDRNKIIKSLAKKHNVPFIDIYELQSADNLKDYSWKYHKFTIFFGYLLVTLFPKLKERINKERKLGLTIDGVHYNDYSAKLIAKEINKIV